MLGLILIPFLGSLIDCGINKLCGFETIDKNDGYSKLMSVSSKIFDSVSALSLMSNATHMTGTVAKMGTTLGKVASVLSYIAVEVDRVVNLSQVDEVSVNLLIGSYFGSSLKSTSHENVSALYVYARQRICDLIKDGLVTYDAKFDGSLTSHASNSKAIQQVKDELKLIRDYLEK